jgi:hypothetical protein
MSSTHRVICMNVTDLLFAHSCAPLMYLTCSMYRLDIVKVRSAGHFGQSVSSPKLLNRSRRNLVYTSHCAEIELYGSSRGCLVIQYLVLYLIKYKPH